MPILILGFFLYYFGFKMHVKLVYKYMSHKNIFIYYYFILRIPAILVLSIF